jgi:hypothetical protein
MHKIPELTRHPLRLSEMLPFFVGQRTVRGHLLKGVHEREWGEAAVVGRRGGGKRLQISCPILSRKWRTIIRNQYAILDYVQFVESCRIGRNCRRVSYIPPQIRIPRLEADGVFAEPPGDDGFVPAVEVVLQAGVDVEGAAGVAEEEDVGAVAYVDDVPEGIVDDVGFDGRRTGGCLELGDVRDLVRFASESARKAVLP